MILLSNEIVYFPLYSPLAAYDTYILGFISDFQTIEFKSK